MKHPKECEYQFEAYRAGREGLSRAELTCKCKECQLQYDAGRKEHARELTKEAR